MKYELVIFDCDGTLVDTESLTSDLLTLMLNEINLSIDTKDVIALFKGKSFSTVLEYIGSNLTTKLEFDFEAAFRRRSKVLFEAKLKAFNCVEGFIEKLKIPFCIASNGPQIKMMTSLEVTGLNKYFNRDHIFSGYDIQKFKPEPDLFLHACEYMGAKVQSTLVIEDTMIGAIAADKANMDVIIHVPIEEEKQFFRNKGYRIFDSYCNLNIE